MNMQGCGILVCWTVNILMDTGNFSSWKEEFAPFPHGRKVKNALWDGDGDIISQYVVLQRCTKRGKTAGGTVRQCGKRFRICKNRMC